MESKSGAIQQPDPKKTGDAADEPPKPPIVVRFWHALWRKRIFFHRGGPNWAEISVVILTGGILLVGGIQAYIYYEQSQTMQRSLEQNQQTIALNMGQVAIAGRNASAAIQTMHIDERARISVTTGKAPITDGKPVVIPVTIVNEGKTSAFNVAGQMVVNLLPVNTEPDYVYKKGHPRYSVDVRALPPNQPQTTDYAVLPKYLKSTPPSILLSLIPK
jgi:hypothetical protein